MKELIAKLEQAMNERWSGQVTLDFYFGKLKKTRFSFTADLDKPFDLPKNKKGDPFKGVVGQ